MIRVPITGSGSKRAVDVTAYGRRIVLAFAWNQRAGAWFVTPMSPDLNQLGAERLARHGTVVANCLDTAGALVGRLAMIDLDPDRGPLAVDDLGVRLQVYGLSAAELATADPAFTLMTVASVSS